MTLELLIKHLQAIINFVHLRTGKIFYCTKTFKTAKQYYVCIENPPWNRSFHHGCIHRYFIFSMVKLYVKRHILLCLPGRNSFAAQGCIIYLLIRRRDTWNCDFLELSIFATTERASVKWCCPLWNQHIG